MITNIESSLHITIICKTKVQIADKNTLPGLTVTDGDTSRAGVGADDSIMVNDNNKY